MYDSIQLVDFTAEGIISPQGPELTHEDTEKELAEQTILSAEPVMGWGNYDTLIQTVDAHDEIRWYLAV